MKNIAIQNSSLCGKYAEENPLRHETSSISSVIGISKSILFDFKTAILEHWNDNETMMETISR